MPSLKLAYLYLASAIALVAVQANALDVNENKSFAQMEQSLAQESQVEIARAKYILNPEDPNQSRVLCVKFTINARGDGYILLSDNMDDTQAHIEMVYGKLKNARVYDPHVTGVIPEGVSRQSNLAAEIKDSALYGDGVMIHGQSVKKGADGIEQILGTTTVMANTSGSRNPLVNNRVGILLASVDDVISLDNIIALELEFREDLPGKPKQ